MSAPATCLRTRSLVERGRHCSRLTRSAASRSYRSASPRGQAGARRWKIRVSPLGLRDRPAARERLVHPLPRDAPLGEGCLEELGRHRRDPVGAVVGLGLVNEPRGMYRPREDQVAVLADRDAVGGELNLERLAPAGARTSDADRDASASPASGGSDGSPCLSQSSASSPPSASSRIFPLRDATTAGFRFRARFVKNAAAASGSGDSGFAFFQASPGTAACLRGLALGESVAPGERPPEPACQAPVFARATRRDARRLD